MCSRAKEVSRATHSCPCCSPSGNILHWLRFQNDCTWESFCLHFMTICTSKVHRTGQCNAPTFCVKSFGSIAGYRSLNNGKTRLWNRAGLFPRDCEILEDAARLVDPDAVVWKGDPDLPLSQQGIKILGVPVGRKEFIEHELDSRATCHAELLEKIPYVKDLQCAWLILLYCGVSRANFFIRAVSPDCSLQFATRHEAQIWRCLTTLVGVLPEAVSDSAKAAATLPLSSGGLGCRSSFRLRHAAHWASWADSIKMIGERHPEVAATMVLVASRPSTLALDTWKKQVLWPQIGSNWLLERSRLPTWLTRTNPTNQGRGGKQPCPASWRHNSGMVCSPHFRTGTPL